MFYLMQIIAIVLLILPVNVMAQDTAQGEVQPEDFALGIHVTPTGDSAVQYFELPYIIYTGLAHADHSDMQLFDANGQIMAWMMHRVKTSESTQANFPVPFFPIYSVQDQRIDDLTLHVERDAKGTVIDVKSGNNPGASDEQKKIIAYILDLQNIQKQPADTLTTLEFDWQQTTDTVWEVSIEGSDDLESWQKMVSNASIARLQYAGQTLDKNRIKMSPTTVKYMRIRWQTGQEDFKLNKITAHYVSSKNVDEWRWHKVDVAYEKTVDGNLNKSGYILNTGGYVPVEKLRFDFGDNNGFYKGKLYSRINTEKPWVLRGTLLQYRLQMQTTLLSSDDYDLRLNTDPHWLLQFDEPRTTTLAGLPEIEIAWRAERIRFLAIGTAPYRLAYGNAAILDLSSVSSSEVLTMLSREKQLTAAAATLGEPFDLGGDQRREIPPAALPWKTLILWFALLAAVVLMGWMAYGLYRQMNDSKDN